MVFCMKSSAPQSVSGSRVNFLCRVVAVESAVYKLEGENKKLKSDSVMKEQMIMEQNAEVLEIKEQLSRSSRHARLVSCTTTPRRLTFIP